MWRLGMRKMADKRPRASTASLGKMGPATELQLDEDAAWTAVYAVLLGPIEIRVK